jgi:N-methylhydantoinase A
MYVAVSAHNETEMAQYLVGVDIGGTFTDCVAVDEHGTVTTAKSPSTPPNFADGMIDALGLVAERLGHSPDAFFRLIDSLSHGTTVGTNAIVQQRGAKVGLITTTGHNDVIHIMRGSRGVGRHDVREIVHFPDSVKPQPIVPKRLIIGVSERVDCLGHVVVPLNEQEVEAAVRTLVAKGVEAIAICFLWSFLYPEHEHRAREIVRRIAPDLFVSCSVDIAPKWGEYERTTAVVLNAYIGPLTAGYLRSLNKRLVSLGYHNPLQITQCGGGTISVDKAMQAPLLTLDSGPVSGVTGSMYLAQAMSYPNVITTDMGGTSFDVGLIYGGKPSYSFVSNVNQYEYFIPKVDIQAIGAGGGSLVRVHPLNRTITVGPQSASAVPGPVCYGRGGTIPTVTDAALVLGYLDPENFAGGRMKLDKRAAEAAITAVGAQIGLSMLECASGIAKIVEFGMADTIRQMTVGKGYDPRDFVLFAFGGAGPVHAGVFARELGVQKIIIPQRETASTWCAFGAASADILHIHERVNIMGSPFNAQRLNDSLDQLKALARAGLEREGIAHERQRLQLSLDMRHKGQINEVEVFLPWDHAVEPFQEELAREFYDRYEQLYGRGASFKGARLEIVTFRVRAMADTPRPRLRRGGAQTAALKADPRRPARDVYWDELKRAVSTSIYDGTLMMSDDWVEGPAIIETPDTSVTVRPGQRLRLDPLGNFELELAPARTATARSAATRVAPEAMS